MITAVLDSNVFVSAFVFGGIPRQVVQFADANAYHLAICEQIRSETERTLLQKFHWSRSRVAQACDPVWQTAKEIIPETEIRASDDPDDDCILECAWDANASVIVTGDRDLLRLNPYQHIAIVTPAQFLRRRSWQRRN